MPQYHDQVAGGSCSLTMYFESSPGVLPDNARGVRMAFMSETFARGSAKKQRSAISGKRGAGKPYEGLPQMSGQVQAASYSPQLGYIFRALCGLPTTAADTLRSLSGAVVQIDHGVVGLPSPGHGFVQDAVITVMGTDNYDGSYRVEYGVTDDLIAVRAPYAAEILNGAGACRGRAPLLEGAAVDMGNGLVGLPCAGKVHSLNEGERVSVSGSLNYDGVYTLAKGSVDGVLVVEAVFADETFDGSLYAVPQFYIHSYELPRRQPTVCVEKYLDFEPDATGWRYQRFGFCKVNGLSFALGGDDELVFTVDFGVGRQDDDTLPVDATPVEPAAIPMDNIESALWIAGERRGDVETGSFSNTFGIQAKAAIGDLGKYSRMSEGDPVIQHTLQAFLEEGRYRELSASRDTVPFAVSVSGASGDEMWINNPETEIETLGTPITGKEGLMQEVRVLAFVDKSASVLSFRLINRVPSYA